MLYTSETISSVIPVISFSIKRFMISQNVVTSFSVLNSTVFPTIADLMLAPFKTMNSLFAIT